MTTESTIVIRPSEPSLFGPALWKTTKGRETLFQCLALIFVLLFVYLIVGVVRQNLDRQNLSLGFGFLNRPAGISIAESILPFQPTDSIGWLIVVGAANTLRVALLSCFFATVLGVIVGVARISSNELLKFITGTYINLARNTPLLLQILFWYAVFLQLPSASQAISIGNFLLLSNRGILVPSASFSGNWSLLAMMAAGLIALAFAGRGARAPSGKRSIWSWLFWIGLGALVLVVANNLTLTFPERRGFNFVGGLSLTPEFTSLVFAQSVYGAAFIAELVRGGIENVARGQKEAGASLGLSQMHILRFIVVPQALLVIIPSVTTQYVSIIKNSSLAVAIGFPDLFWSLSSAIAISGHSIEGVVIMIGGYLIPTLIAALAMNRFNRRLVLRGQR